MNDITLLLNNEFILLYRREILEFPNYIEDNIKTLDRFMYGKDNLIKVINIEKGIIVFGKPYYDKNDNIELENKAELFLKEKLDQITFRFNLKIGTLENIKFPINSVYISWAIPDLPEKFNILYQDFKRWNKKTRDEFIKELQNTL
jgi:hypothetical protein